jgi:NodT family efflux transporter outer membrane factor (OMF) lipoprotein
MSALDPAPATASTPRKARSGAQRGAWLGVIAAAMLGACAVGPDFVRPAPPKVDRYTSQPLAAATVAADGHAQQFTPGMTLTADWWRLFGSTQLDALVQQAVANNPTLEAAEASLRQSQDNLRAGYGVFFPQVAAGLNAVRERAVPLENGLQTRGTVFNLVTLSGTVSYALDVFGGKRRAVESLRAQADDARYASQAAYLTLSANVVNASIARAAYAAEIRATRELIELEKQQLGATEAQVQAGTTSYASVLSIRSLIAANQAALAPLEQKISQTEHLLATLEGVTPAEAKLPDIELGDLTLPVDLPVSLPSELVRQRPDILSAEAQLHAASANIGVATAAMFPSISLSGSYGGAGTSFGSLSANSVKFWSIGPSVTVPLFQGGSLWFGRKAAIDAYQQAQANYRQTVLSAFEQVADTLKALEHDAQALEAQAEAQRTAAAALALLQVNYRAGMAAYIDVLTADVQYHAATIAYLQTVAQRHQDTVALFVALGGGWWSVPSPLAEGHTP